MSDDNKPVVGSITQLTVGPTETRIEMDLGTYRLPEPFATIRDLRTRLAEVERERDELEERWKAELGHANGWSRRAHEAAADRDEARAQAAALRSALQWVCDYGFDHPDHREDECPDDCDYGKDHEVANRINEAMNSTAGRDLLEWARVARGALELHAAGVTNAVELRTALASCPEWVAK